MSRSTTVVLARAGECLAAALVLALQGLPAAQAPAAPRADLLGLFAPGGMLQDKNGDGVIDAVNARIVMGTSPTANEVSAAADVAARLGFETSAMDLPIVRASGPFPIAIGA